jgi:hypothetical protein
MQVPEMFFQIAFIVGPRLSIDARGGPAPKRIEGLLQEFDSDVVQ